MAGKNDGKIRCSFCGKTQDQVNRLISGPNGAFICDECIDICAEILEEEGVEGHEDTNQIQCLVFQTVTTQRDAQRPAVF